MSSRPHAWLPLVVGGLGLLLLVGLFLHSGGESRTAQAEAHESPSGDHEAREERSFVPNPATERVAESPVADVEALRVVEFR